ncbi:MAG TPA: SIS domain-containing protein [Bellilinea sp.]|nr:SIS domain-containing protein [Bellilinea sp.]
MTIPSRFIQDILDQPRVLRNALAAFPYREFNRVAEKFQAGEFDRVVLTGMGGSLSSLMATSTLLSQSTTPIILLETAELIHYRLNQITANSLVWIVPQSGNSVEIVKLLDHLQENRPAAIIGTTNNPEGSLAKAADVVIPISAGDEFTVSTKTFTSTLALDQLAATKLLGNSLGDAVTELEHCAEMIGEYLSNFDARLAELKNLLGDSYKRAILVGRGTSMATVMGGSLILKEASKTIIEGMSTSHFRHGPLELVEPGFSLLVLAGTETTRELNRRIALEVKRLGGNVLWFSPVEDEDLTTIKLPAVSDLALPVMEMIPFQLLTIVISQIKGIEPGIFRNISKVTRVE